ncbi:helix-turn-helix domain-containing protein [Bacillus methanolicus]|uniref:HTH cro/C1-type domain-containing protein n=1 Tax=Bacillus methanolicus (strain MGA3 / ATCC 53907) TaxID=796606 RepID=I3DTG1_BACMM|nr:helix-turn-helix transcriptional regulator [Bacillus methanolicus]AIE61740.1 hypothetical protein BMMGA3_16955 [Bacillus methanolicus MGA3]EIJ77532.1 DNA-binding protein [Bacillus methanolicus MGA3]
MINEIEIKKNFGQTLKKIRTKKGFSQEDLADLSGLHRTYISEVERGDRNISLINIHKICAALNIPASTFFRKMEEEN